MKDIDYFNEIHLDALKEIGNIGAGNAAISLSILINKIVDMNVPQIQVVEFTNIDEYLGDADKLVAGVLLEFTGDIDGTIMFILDNKSVINMKSFFLHIPGITMTENFSEIDISLFKEIGNILATSFLNSLSELTKLNAKPSVPQFSFDMLGAILSLPLTEFGQVGDKVLFFDAEFIEGIHFIKSHFFIMPSTQSYSTILEALGVR